MEECRDKFLVDKLVNAARTSRIIILYLKKIQLELRLLKVDVEANYLIGITQQKELMVLSLDKILGFRVLNSFSKDFKTIRNQQKQSKKLSPKEVFTPTLTKDNKSSLELLTKLPKLCSDNKSIKSNVPNQKQITKSSPTAEKTQPLIPTNDVFEQIKEEIHPSPTAEKTQSPIPANDVSRPILKGITQKTNLTQIAKKYKNQETKNDATVSIRNQNGNSIIS